TMISFRIGHSDAGVFEQEFGDTFAQVHFSDLNRYEILVRLLENGISSVPFRATTLSPIQLYHGRRQQLIEHSRQRFARPRVEVEAKIDRWMNPISPVENHFERRGKMNHA